MSDPYYGLKYVSQSSLKLFMKSAAEYKYCEDAGSSGVSTGATSLGSLVHAMLLEPATLDEHYFVYDEGTRPDVSMTMAAKANKAWKAEQELLASSSSKVLVQQATYMVADTMTQVVCSHELAASYLFPQEGTWDVILKEKGIIWTSDVSNLVLKSKLDQINVKVHGSGGDCVVLDYKTTSAINMEQFGWSVKKYGYDIQAAFYRDAVTSYLEETYPGVVFTIQVLFIPQKSSAPYQVLGVCELDERTIELAKDRYENALRELEGCYATGNWDMGGGIQVLQLSKPVDDLFSEEEIIL